MVSYRNKVPRWPHRRIKSLDKSIAELEETILDPASADHEAELLSQIRELRSKRDYIMKCPESIIGSGGFDTSNPKRKREAKLAKLAVTTPPNSSPRSSSLTSANFPSSSHVSTSSLATSSNTRSGSESLSLMHAAAAPESPPSTSSSGTSPKRVSTRPAADRRYLTMRQLVLMKESRSGNTSSNPHSLPSHDALSHPQSTHLQSVSSSSSSSMPSQPIVTSPASEVTSPRLSCGMADLELAAQISSSSASGGGVGVGPDSHLVTSDIDSEIMDVDTDSSAVGFENFASNHHFDREICLASNASSASAASHHGHGYAANNNHHQYTQVNEHAEIHESLQMAHHLQSSPTSTSHMVTRSSSSATANYSKRTKRANTAPSKLTNDYSSSDEHTSDAGFGAVSGVSDVVGASGNNGGRSFIGRGGNSVGAGTFSSTSRSPGSSSSRHASSPNKRRSPRPLPLPAVDRRITMYTSSAPSAHPDCDQIHQFQQDMTHMLGAGGVDGAGGVGGGVRASSPTTNAMMTSRSSPQISRSDTNNNGHSASSFSTAVGPSPNFALGSNAPPQPAFRPIADEDLSSPTILRSAENWSGPEPQYSTHMFQQSHLSHIRPQSNPIERRTLHHSAESSHRSPSDSSLSEVSYSAATTANPTPRSYTEEIHHAQAKQEEMDATPPHHDAAINSNFHNETGCLAINLHPNSFNANYPRSSRCGQCANCMAYSMSQNAVSWNDPSDASQAPSQANFEATATYAMQPYYHRENSFSYGHDPATMAWGETFHAQNDSVYSQASAALHVQESYQSYGYGSANFGTAYGGAQHPYLPQRLSFSTSYIPSRTSSISELSNEVPSVYLPQVDAKQVSDSSSHMAVAYGQSNGFQGSAQRSPPMPSRSPNHTHPYAAHSSNSPAPSSNVPMSGNVSAQAPVFSFVTGNGRQSPMSVPTSLSGYQSYYNSTGHSEHQFGVSESRRLSSSMDTGLDQIPIHAPHPIAPHHQSNYSSLFNASYNNNHHFNRTSSVNWS